MEFIDEELVYHLKDKPYEDENDKKMYTADEYHLSDHSMKENLYIIRLVILAPKWSWWNQIASKIWKKIMCLNFSYI